MLFDLLGDCNTQNISGGEREPLEKVMETGNGEGFSPSGSGPEPILSVNPIVLVANVNVKVKQG